MAEASAPARTLNVLLSTKGHPFIREPFFSMFDSFAPQGISWTHVEQPASQLFYQPGNAEPYDVIVDYSMQGMRPDADGTFPQPPQAFKDGILALMEQGTHGFVFIHHHICSWVGWPEYAEIIGGRFQYYPNQIRGETLPDSGYLLGVRSKYVVVTPEHPVTAGLPPEFDLQDELYLSPYFEADVVPLVRSNFEFTDENFFSPYQVMVNRRMYTRDGWHHPPTSSMVAWAKHYRNSPIVYIQAGDVPTSYNNPAYRTLLSNAIKWVGSDEAKAWARARNQGTATDPKPSVTVTPHHQEWPFGSATPRRHPHTPDRTCLFCEQDGVERYGGIMDQHLVSNGSEEVRGPLCGNCHVLLLKDQVDTGGWRIKDA